MRKLLILAGAVVFLAAACNSETAVNNQTTAQTPTQSSTQTTASAKVDATVNALDKNVDAESGVNMQSDSDIIGSDETIINSYNGAANASSY